MDTEQQLVHAKRFGDVIVSTQFKTFDHILLGCLRRQENDRNPFVDLLDFLGQCEAIHQRHHNIKNTKVEVSRAESLERFYADELEIRLSDGRVLEAEIVGSDEAADVAVVKVNEELELTPVKIGKSSDLKVGER